MMGEATTYILVPKRKIMSANAPWNDDTGVCKCIVKPLIVRDAKTSAGLAAWLGLRTFIPKASTTSCDGTHDGTHD